MKKLRYGIAVGVALLVVGCGGKQENISHESIAKIHEREGIPVRLDEVKVRKLEKLRLYGGSLEGIQQKGIYAAKPEEVKELLVQIGDVVAKDQVLARLDREGVTPDYRMLEAQFKVAKASVERVRKLYESGGVSKQNLDEAEAGLAALEAQRDAMEKVIEIRAPIAGVVTDLYTRQGAVAIAGRDEHPLMQIADISQMVLRAPVGSKEIHNIRKGQSVRIRVGDRLVAGSVTKVPLAANPVTRMFHVEMTFNNGSRVLRPGMYVQAEVALETQNVMSVPKEAVVVRGDSSVVYKVEEDRAVAVGVEAGMISGPYIAIEGALLPGDRIVSEGNTLLHNSENKVKVIGGGAK